MLESSRECPPWFLIVAVVSSFGSWGPHRQVFHFLEIMFLSLYLTITLSLIFNLLLWFLIIFASNFILLGSLFWTIWTKVVSHWYDAGFFNGLSFFLGFKIFLLLIYVSPQHYRLCRSVQLWSFLVLTF